jgi:hypothetical protein
MNQTKYNPKEVQHSPMAPGQIIDISHLISSIGSAFTYPLTRKGMGVSAMNWLGPVAFFAMLAIAEMYRCGAILAYSGLWIAACFVQLFLRDRRQHSKYRGWPLTATLFRLRNEASGRVLEAILVFVVGVVLGTMEIHIGGFFMGAALCLFVREGIERAVEQKRIREMWDRAIEQQQMSNGFYDQGF